VILNAILGFPALLSAALLLWQWLVARRFPLHQRVSAHAFPPAVTLLKPLKGCEPATEACLRSWFAQEYTGRVQILFGVASGDDPVCEVVRKLQQEFPGADSQLVVCGPLRGANAKVSKLVELERLAKHEIFVISDADVCVPPDLLANVLEPLRDAGSLAHPIGEGSGVRPCGLVNCLYCLANPTTLAMQWEAVAMNADFWSQVLQAQSLKPLDFALGAVMAMRRKQLEEIGGFAALADCLADDYQLGHRLAQRGYLIALSTVVVECWSAPMGWAAVWKHQLRWARTIRVCQPASYFFSILSNATFWPLLWLATSPSTFSLVGALVAWSLRIAGALDLQARLLRSTASTRQSQIAIAPWWLVPLKDLLQSVLWLLAFAGNRIEWRGERMRLLRDGTLAKVS
jgi:ceramide glucosyltransferase